METITGKDIFFNFKEVNNHNLKNYAGYDFLRQIVQNESSGVVFRNVLKKEMLDEYTKDLNAIPEHLFNDVIFGSIFPLPFATITDQESVNQYFDSQRKFQDYIESNSIKEVNAALISFFQKISSSIKLETLEDPLEKKAYSLATLRRFFPLKGGLHIHCGHGHHDVPFYKRLSADVVLTPQFSFFLVLQNSEEGGELTIYDLLCEKGQHKDYHDNNDYILDKNDSQIKVSDLRSFQIRPRAGDVLVFAGGDIYHRVEQIKGTSDRITYGGFINFSKDFDKFYLWS